MNRPPEPERYLLGSGRPRDVRVPARIAKWIDVQLDRALRIDARGGLSRELYEVLQALRMARFEYELAQKDSASGIAELPPVDESAVWERGAGARLGTVAVAERLGCGARNVRGLAARGQLRGDCAGGRWTFDAADVDDYLAQRARTE